LIKIQVFPGAGLNCFEDPPYRYNENAEFHSADLLVCHSYRMLQVAKPFLGNIRHVRVGKETKPDNSNHDLLIFGSDLFRIII
jgi:hypothetical protein